MSGLPPGWVAGTLGDFAEPVRVGIDPASVPGFPYLGLEHVQAQTTNILGSAFASSVRSTSYEFAPGATLFARLRPYLNKVCTPTFKGIGSGEFIIFPACAYLAPSFLKYLLNQPAFVEFTSTLDTGDRPRVNWNGIKNFSCALPPLAEQKRIVAAIEEQFSRLDAGMAALQRIRRNIKRARGAVLQAAITGMLSVDCAAPVGSGGVEDDPLAAHLNATNARKVQRATDDLLPLTWDIPRSWTWKSASDVCEVVASGSTPAKAAMTAGRGDVPFIKVYNLTHSGDLDFSVRPTFIDRATHEGSLRRSRLYPGDVLTNIVGPPLGKVSVVPNEYPEWNTNQAVVVFRPVPSIHPRLLRYWLLSPPVLKLLESTSRATAGQFNVSLTTCRALPLPIPPRAEQDALVAILEDCFSLLDVVEVAAEHALSRSSSLRASVLATAFSGKLVAQDSSDEPASVLLEHIAAERASPNGRESVKAHSRRRSKVTA